MRRRGIVVVHGLGEQLKGDTLNYIARPVVDFVEANLPDGAAVELEVHYDPPSGPATAIITFQEEDGVVEEWTIAEAWWAKAFIPSPTDELLVWAYRLAINRLGRVVGGVLGIGPGPSYYRPAVKIPDSRRSYLQRIPRKWESRVWDGLIALPWVVLFAAGLVPALLLAASLYILGHLPILDWAIKPAQEKFAAFLVPWLGDQHAMTINRLARDSISTTILETVRGWMVPEAKFDSVTIVAHSGGCVAAFDAVTGPEFKRLVEKEGIPDVTLITTGSALNPASTFERGASVWSPLPDQVRWLDLWTRYDVVPAGPPEKRLRNLARADNLLEYRVSNFDNPVEDHGGYFTNQEEVVGRIVRSILRGRRGCPASLLSSSEDAVHRSGQHRQAVAFRAGARILFAGLSVTYALVSGAHYGVGALVLLALPSRENPSGLLAGVVAWGHTEAGLGIMGLVVWLFITFTLWQITTLELASSRRTGRLRPRRAGTDRIRIPWPSWGFESPNVAQEVAADREYRNWKTKVTKKLLAALCVGTALWLAIMMLTARTFFSISLPLPDVRVTGYDPVALSAVLSELGASGRWVYGLAAITLDIVFPVLYGSLFAAATIRWTPRPIASQLLKLIVAVVLLDFTENLLVVITVALFSVGGSAPIGGAGSLIVYLASIATILKWWLGFGWGTAMFVQAVQGTFGLPTKLVAAVSLNRTRKTGSHNA